MSSTYNIDYSDPLVPGFTIGPGIYNGPGSPNPTTSLRLYGRGALEWGEGVNENLLRLLEHWSGSTYPPFPSMGQIWHQVAYFWKSTTGWYVYPQGGGAWLNVTTSVTGGVGGSPTPPASPQLGGSSMWFTNAAPTIVLDAYGNPVVPYALYVYDQAYKQVAPGWVRRHHVSRATAPTNTTNPPQDLKIYDKIAQTWNPLPTIYVAPTTSPPPTANQGELWYNTTTNVLNVFNGTTWVGLVTADGNTIMTGDLNMGGNQIINVGAPVNATDAATKGYVDTATSLTTLAATLDGRYVNVTGDTMTGDLTMGGNQVFFTSLFLNEGNGDSQSVGPDIRGSAQLMLSADDNIVLMVDNDNTVNGDFIVAKGGSYVSDTLTVKLLTVANNGRISSNTASYETLVTTDNTLTNKKYVDDTTVSRTGDSLTAGHLTLFQNPTSSMHATTKGYVDTAITNVNNSINNVVNSLPTNIAAVLVSNSTIYTSAGAICINASTGHIWIALYAGSTPPTYYSSNGSDARWKQVFPATYS